MTEQNVSAPIKTEPIANEIKRIDLNEKISFNVLSKIIKLDSKFNGLAIVQDDNGSSTIIVVGTPNSIKELENLMDSLPKLKSLTKNLSPEIKSKKAVEPEKKIVPKIIEKQKKIVIIDLNYADAVSLNEPLRALSDNGDYGGNVVVHNDTNQIVLQGYEEWVSEMAFAIRKLDRKPRQIFVDAIIAEISDQTT